MNNNKMEAKVDEQFESLQEFAKDTNAKFDASLHVYIKNCLRLAYIDGSLNQIAELGAKP